MSLSTWARSPPTSPACFARRSKEQDCATSSIALRPLKRSTSTATCGKKSSLTYYPTRSSSPSTARSASRCDESDGYVELTVRDTGTGISEEELPHVFERFHRVRDARARTFEGSGIGLSLVQELARMHGGDVSVESVYGEGSTFRVRIATGIAHLPADRIGAGRALASTAMGAAPYISEALRWLPESEPFPVEEDSLAETSSLGTLLLSLDESRNGSSACASGRRGSRKERRPSS